MNAIILKQVLHSIEQTNLPACWQESKIALRSTIRLLSSCVPVQNKPLLKYIVAFLLSLHPPIP